MNYFWYFLFYSLIGYFMETAFAFLTRHHFEQRKTMRISPLCPVYGLGSLGILLIAENLGNSIAFIFFWGVLVCTVTEYLYGFFCARFFHVTLWDYSEKKRSTNMPVQQASFICLPFSMLWGALSVLLYYGLHPAIVWLTERIIWPVTFAAVILFLIDLILTFRLMYQIGTEQIVWKKEMVFRPYRPCEASWSDLSKSADHLYSVAEERNEKSSAVQTTISLPPAENH